MKKLVFKSDVKNFKDENGIEHQYQDIYGIFDNFLKIKIDKQSPEYKIFKNWLKENPNETIEISGSIKYLLK